MINVSVLSTGTVVVPRARYRRLVRRSLELGCKQPTDRLPHGNTLHLARGYSPPPPPCSIRQRRSWVGCSVSTPQSSAWLHASIVWAMPSRVDQTRCRDLPSSAVGHPDGRAGGARERRDDAASVPLAENAGLRLRRQIHFLGTGG